MRLTRLPGTALNDIDGMKNLETFGCLLCPSKTKLERSCRTGGLDASNCLQIFEVNTVRSFLS
jgi:hypothetical protein